MLKKKRVFIDGMEGTTGLRIRERLENRDDIELIQINRDLRKDVHERAECIMKSDLAVLCLPDTGSREIVGHLLKEGKDFSGIIDTSTAFRTDPDWVYGMPELTADRRQAIKNSKLVSVPGCHAGGFILLTLPLIEAGVIKPGDLVNASSITGYSGGGKSMIEKYEKGGDQSIDFPSMYGLLQDHKHLPEMKAITGLENAPVFLPIVANHYSGMTLGLTIGKVDNLEDIRDIYKKKYENEKLLRVSDDSPAKLNSFKMSGRDDMEIFVVGNEERAVAVACYDNLGKGASGTAIQCLNIMLGKEEEEGLIWK